MFFVIENLHSFSFGFSLAALTNKILVLGKSY